MRNMHLGLSELKINKLMVGKHEPNKTYGG
jgi:hypothetical protein